jgi:hypothetical protein
MATSISSINDSVVMEKAIQALKASLIPVRNLTHEAILQLAGRPVIKGDAAVIQYASKQTAVDKTPGIEPTAGGTVAGKAVTFNQYKSAPFYVPDGAGKPGTFEALAVEASYAIGKAVIDYVCGLVLKANYGDDDGDKVVCAPGDFGNLNLAALKQKAGLKLLGRKRSLILNPAYSGQVFADTNVGLILAFNGIKAYETGVLPDLLGMNAFEYDALSDNGENLGGFLCDDTAIALGIAPVTPQAAPGNGDLIAMEIVTDPDSEVAMTYKRSYHSKEGAMRGEFEVLFGASVGNNSIVRIVSA